MEYIILFLQLLLWFSTVFVRKDEGYIILIKKLDKLYLIVECIIQGLFFIGNIVLLFVAKDMMLQVFECDIFVTVIIKMTFNPVAKKQHFERLKNILIEDKLFSMDTGAIRRHIIEKYGLVYSTKEIDKQIDNIIEDQK